MAENKNTREKGSKAEEIVVDYIKSKGFEIIDRNFFMRGGEIDIIAKKDNLILFVEVRSWNRVYWENGSPLETVSLAKIKKIQKTAIYYIHQKKINLQKVVIRFDVAGLIKNGNSYKIEYIENAFSFNIW